MFFLIIFVIVTILAVIFRHKVTLPFIVVVCGVFALWGFLFTPFKLVVFDTDISPFISCLLPILVCGGFVYLKFRTEAADLRFKGRILSLSMFMPSKKIDGRNLGKIVPYCDNQVKYNNHKLYQSDVSCKGGTIITGSSGSGKTCTLENIIAQDLARGNSAIFVDFKGQDDVKQEILALHPNSYLIDAETCNFSYDPLINLSTSGKVETIMGFRKWDLSGSDAYYKTNMQVFLQRTIDEYDKFRSAQNKTNNYLLGYYEWLQTYETTRDMYEAYQSLLRMIELVLSSSLKQMVADNTKVLDLHKNREQFVAVFSFTSSAKELGTAVSSLLFNDLLDAGTKCAFNPPITLVVDEYGSCQNPLVVKDILEKGRSANIETIISMQDLNQVVIQSNTAFLDSLLGTTNSFITFHGCTREMAEKLSNVQIKEVDNILMTLKKPYKGKPPVALFISKYPVFSNATSEVYKFIPARKGKLSVSDMVEQVKTIPQNEEFSFGKNVATSQQKQVQVPQPIYQEVTPEMLTETEKSITINNVDDWL